MGYHKKMKKISEKVKQTVNIPEEYLSITPPAPKSVKIEITSRCDLKCFFCVVAYKKREKSHINKDLLYRILNEIKEAGVKEVGLFWLGEPFLNDELPDYVAYAKKIGIPYVFITTNGRLASKDKLKRVFDSGLDSIKFSINAKNKEDFKNTTGVDAFDQVINHIQLAYKVRDESPRPSIFASTVFDPKREKDYWETDALISPFVDEHYKLRLYGDKTFSTNEDEVGSIVNHRHNRSISEMLPCWSLFTLPHITYNGFMSACYCDFNPDYFMADLKKVSFIDAWHSNKFMKLREKHLEENILGTPGKGFKQFLQTLTGGRITIGALSLGTAQGAYERAVKYSFEREAFSKPINKFQGVSFKLADMATQIEAGRQMMLNSAHLKMAGEPCLKEASMAKLLCSEMAERVCSDAIQIHGGYGYLSDFPVERLYRDARVCQIYEGTSEVQKLLIVRTIKEDA